ncbi:hypothetical protein EPN83_01590 [Patescibacteria group bacterium]|nr:MAG: hypothetical protein EPN83_01590 [Patescibacteria group bacterium]
MKVFKKILKVSIFVFLTLLALLLVLSVRKNPETIFYGASFSKLRSDELGLDWEKVYMAVLDDLGVRKLRLSAHWPMVEPERDNFNFSELDFQIREAEKREVGVILSIGRRLPDWPECHVPGWAKSLSWEEQKERILLVIEKLVTRYKNYENLQYWQVENEPFLEIFAKEHCGDLDQDFLKKEIDLVKRLDPKHPILVTDSGNLGLWYGAWRSGDAFGTSVYMYLWNPELGQIKSVYLPSFYKLKTNLMTLLFGKKESLLIELSLEPWLIAPALDNPIEVQIDRMSLDKFEEVIVFARKTGFVEQYLWGAEWWYWMKGRGHGEYWERAKILFQSQ